MHDTDIKNLLLIHIILGAEDFAKIKMGYCRRVGHIDEQFAEETKVGWVIMSPGRERDKMSALFIQTPTNDYENYPGIKRVSLKR